MFQPLNGVLNTSKKQEAREAYANIMAVKHATFKVNPAGLRMCTRATISGSCCGEGLLEIKCPFKYRNSQPASIEDESFYLHKVGSEVTLLSSTRTDGHLEETIL